VFHRLPLVLILGFVFITWAPPGHAARCATGLRGDQGGRVTSLAPLRRGAASRVSAPWEGYAGQAHATEHFRILWGDAYDRSDPDWGDPDGDGVPTWVSDLGEALEDALAEQTALGFAEPYGANRYYLDVFVANTGLQVRDRPIALGEDYYGYTSVDPEFGLAYFVFGDDFSAHARDELAVLRATAAHELFHAVQRAYYPWDDGAAIPTERWRREGWWFEATATWMEEVCEPAVDDYVPFVREFLAAPARPLFAMDGRREYGAAIFPGYLWLEHGGARLWRAVFEGAEELGLEAALGQALADSGTDLSGAVARFWAFAGHPEDLWPDGARYRSAAAPALLLTGSALPVSVETTDLTGPERFGANLLRLRAGAGPVELEWGSPAPVGVVVGASTGGGAAAVEVVATDQGGARIDGPFPSGEVYLALVNTSPEEGPLRYRTVLQDADSPGAPPSVSPSDRGGGGAGGCFLGVLSPP